mmetsp:Transcript_25977/g.38386  ORF Transcript_25977/g.38386 Transcript_25977/m.38386 type:complete len:465 (+) Transcript_25977:136-1530(+)|eukprot:CAMPEP_0194207404 /NCGR_PEP_ID=MMETSP0156-20130528/6159_1 /TAXON_ID=33649 /ORGANISM="Thalassionema nitzschioides, Strain L26-B" /LENGTH=464 /DNA_ID=CAMNT_0038934165 /DNA_START=102 /DNA_END=1496 /DNA_ORIENTATION=-
MSSGTIPIETYHRAQSVGAGTYGSVMVVYNDQGEEFAMKLFLDDDEDASPGIDVGSMREISILRLFRDENSHPNIVQMHDLKEFDPCEEVGAGIPADCNGIIMPLFRHGTLGDAINKQILTSRKDKVAIAHGVLSAVAHLHENGIMHRDIKGDNVMLHYNESSKSENVSCWEPVLIDFSLAKVVNGRIYNHNDKVVPVFDKLEGMTHTGTVGTVTYIAPEVVSLQPYSFPSDLWSVGVILLELIQNRTLKVDKNKEALRLIESLKEQLPDQPFPNLIRGLLSVDSRKRLTAREALDSPLFHKFGFIKDKTSVINIDEALPLEYHEDSNILENIDLNNPTPAKQSYSKGNIKTNKKKKKREDTIRRLCSNLGFENPITPIAAMCYAQQIYQEIDDTIDNLDESQGLLDCVILANRFFEVELLDLNSLDETGPSFSDWSLEEYLDTENTLFVLMDYCLLPRCSHTI